MGLAMVDVTCVDMLSDGNLRIGPFYLCMQ